MYRMPKLSPGVSLTLQHIDMCRMFKLSPGVSLALQHMDMCRMPKLSPGVPLALQHIDMCRMSKPGPGVPLALQHTDICKMPKLSLDASLALQHNNNCGGCLSRCSGAFSRRALPTVCLCCRCFGDGHDVADLEVATVGIHRPGAWLRPRLHWQAVPGLVLPPR